VFLRPLPHHPLKPYVNMASKTKFVMYAAEPKDLSVWFENKEMFRQLYIVEKKSLKQVKEIMETQHGFPEAR
jgi:hypothetical protein